MALDETMQKWLNEKLLSGLPEDARKTFTEHLQKEEVANELKRAMMAPSDYSRKMDELTKQDQQRIQQLAEWQRNEKASYESQMRQAIEENNAAWQTQIQQQANDAGIQLNINQPSTQRPSSDKGSANNGTNGTPQYFTKEQFDTELRQREAEYAMLPAVQHQIATMHRRMFNDDLDMVKLTQEAFRLGKPLNAVWEEMYNVPAKRAELDKAAFDAKVQEEARKLATSMASGQGMQGEHMRPASPLSPIGNFLRNSSQAASNGNEPLIAPKPANVTSQAVNEATDAFYSGKYAVKYPGQA